MASSPDEMLRAYFSSDAVLAHYLRATAAVGLWRSEEILFERTFSRKDTLLEVGCGTGRIAFGLHELGFQHILGVDLFKAMIEAARDAARSLDYAVSFQMADACKLPFEDALFDGAIFGFNGLMQIPSRERRRMALREIRRVLAPGSHFVFTTHDRDSSHFRDYWAEEAERWDRGTQDPRHREFGDRVLSDADGELFIHVPDETEVREDLVATEWILVETAMRRDIASEPLRVREFSDDCRFWVTRKHS